MRHLVMSIIGKWRLLWGFCPECNSDAPDLYECAVCQFYKGHFPPSEAVKQEWWMRWKQRHNL